MTRTFISLSLLSLIWLGACSSNTNPKKSSSGADSIQPKVEQTSQAANNEVVTGSGTVITMTKAMFIEKVFDYEKNPQQWAFKGSRPCIIDFYATWCGPCKRVAPIMEDLAKKYNGQIDVYKVDTDQEQELAQVFGIRSIPSVLFCPATGNPQMTQGALPQETFEKITNEFLLGKK